MTVMLTVCVCQEIVRILNLRMTDSKQTKRVIKTGEDGTSGAAIKTPDFHKEPTNRGRISESCMKCGGTWFGMLNSTLCVEAHY